MQRVILMLLCLAAGNALAIESLWSARETRASGLLHPPLAVGCAEKVAKPFTDTLNFESKYNQNDATKTERRSVSAQTRKGREALDGFAKAQVEWLLAFERADSSDEAQRALACLNENLEQWANAGAVLADAPSSSGKAARKWFLAAIGAVLLKAEALSNGRYHTPDSVSLWLNRLADAVIADYGPRQSLEYQWFNNHDYWAAWAVATVAMLNQRSEYLRFAERTFELALEQGQQARNGSLYWPLEVARGELAVDYSSYAMVPVALLAETLAANDRPLSAEQAAKLGALADFAAIGVLRPGSLAELTETPKVPSLHKLNWVLPLLSVLPSHKMAAELKDKYRSKLGFYGQLGGDLRALYAPILHSGD
ncbi:alginate lyase family protein [Shewanella sp. JM162201]|uniref:Alginate lyase family protein n=1 Tax=Shewanella jiangmenensis TaxID=2837387 RepID=A0ABS5V3S1_9GAMM|nr:alginate lyase family protein [Shewanella jiangmenensis]MBT1445101.1 alginate lyase family protein [Shewanella jiangmenensis]